jgi:hypothetical protein
MCMCKKARRTPRRIARLEHALRTAGVCKVRLRAMARMQET